MCDWSIQYHQGSTQLWGMHGGCPLVAAQWQSTASSRKVSWFDSLWLPTFPLFSLFTTLFIFISNVRQDVLSIILYCDTPKFIVDQCTVPLTYRCCAVLQPKYCCGDYNCGHRYYCTYCWIPGWSFSVPLHQLPSTTDLQAWPILPPTPTAEGGVSFQSTTTNWSRVWGGSWTETEQVLWNL